VSDRAFFDYGLTFVPPISLGGDDVALMVVDMQYSDAAAGMGFQAALDVIDPGSAAYFDERVESLVVPNIARLVDAFRQRDLPIVYLCLGAEQRDLSDLPPRMAAWIHDVEERSGIRDIFWRGNPLFAVRREFTPQDGDIVVHKTTFGAFNSSNLDDVLREHGLQTIVMVGISTNCCVETTARDAADRGYAVVIVDEACADYDEAAHDASLRAFHFNFGRVVRTPDDVLAAVDAAAEV
jgi:nicotinamidase-related amidase